MTPQEKIEEARKVLDEVNKSISHRFNANRYSQEYRDALSLALRILERCNGEYIRIKLQEMGIDDHYHISYVAQVIIAELVKEDV